MPVPEVPQPGVCGTCHSGAQDGYPFCYPCGNSYADLPEVTPITMSIHGGLIHQHLRDYKDSFDPKVRVWKTRRLAALTAVFLHHHHECVGAFDSVFAVPSEKRCAPADIVRKVIRLRDCDQVTAVVTNQGAMSISQDIAGRRVLVFDDTFTTGKSVWHAYRAVKAAGATVVGPLVVGRHVAPDWEPSAKMLSWLDGRPWSESSCCHCGGESQTPGAFPI